MKRLLLLLFIALGFTLQAQQAPVHVCGTTHEDQYYGLERLTKNRELSKHLQDPWLTENEEGIQYVPLRIISVSNDDGTEAGNRQGMINAICILNDIYAVMDIQFYLFSIEELQNTDVNENSSSNQSVNDLFNYVRGRFDAINVFITKDPVISSGNTITNGFYRPAFPGIGGNDYIVVRSTELTSPITLPHEVGHYFGLSHTFFGWEVGPGPYDDSGVDQPAPRDITIGTGEVIEIEKVTRFYPPAGDTKMYEYCDTANCRVAADRICDTPPDYHSAFGPAYSSGPRNCIYSGGALDPCGEEIDPMENNMMGYFAGCDPYEFTPDQQIAIRTDLMMGADRIGIRRNLREAGEIDLTEITQAPTLVAPADDETLQFFGAVNLEWDPVPNATWYLVQVTTNPTFSSEAFSKFVREPRATISGTTANRLYFWRVIPFSEAKFCNLPISEERSFRAGSVMVSTNDLESVGDMSVFPNPISNGQQLSISVNAKKSMEANFEVSDITGRTVKTIMSHNLHSGDNMLSIDTDDLQTGTYTLRLYTEEGFVVERFVVHNRP